MDMTGLQHQRGKVYVLQDVQKTDDVSGRFPHPGSNYVDRGNNRNSCLSGMLRDEHGEKLFWTECNLAKS